MKIYGFIKGLIMLARPHIFLGWMVHPLKTISNTIDFSRWLSAQDKENILNDFYKLRRDYPKRYQLYEYVVDKMGLEHGKVDYLEFGVASGASFRWWLNRIKRDDTRFYGFDTFEGLPEKWGVYDRGEMAFGIPDVEDARAVFVKGLFQATVTEFLSGNNLRREARKVVHMDADLFSSTWYILSSILSHLKKGDILIFDEFNVPNHEFLAFKLFTETCYVKTRMIGAVNNYLQTAFIVEETLADLRQDASRNNVNAKTVST